MYLQLCEGNNAIVIDIWERLKKAKTQYQTAFTIFKSPWENEQNPPRFSDPLWQILSLPTTYAFKRQGDLGETASISRVQSYVFCTGQCEFRNVIKAMI